VKRKINAKEGNFAPWEEVPGANWIGDGVEPRAVLDGLERRTIYCSCWDVNPKLSSQEI
jgi:hypothetical protein